MKEYFYELSEAGDEQFCEFLELFQQEIYEGTVSLLEAVVSCRPVDEEKRMKIKVQLKDDRNKRYSITTGENFTNYGLFAHFVYKLIDVCQCSGLVLKMYGHKSGFQMSYGLEK